MDQGTQAGARIPLVLIAEDAAHVRRVCSVLLRDHGIQVVEVENGREAVAFYAAHRPNVVVMDINMPGLDGLAALSQIMKLDPQARVVMLTASGEREKVLAAIRAGARDYVVKPFQVNRLLKAVTRLLDESTAGPSASSQ